LFSKNRAGLVGDDLNVFAVSLQIYEGGRRLSEKRDGREL